MTAHWTPMTLVNCFLHMLQVSFIIYNVIVKELWLCLWELWPSIINTTQQMLITECLSSHRNGQSSLTNIVCVLKEDPALGRPLSQQLSINNPLPASPVNCLLFGYKQLHYLLHTPWGSLRVQTVLHGVVAPCCGVNNKAPQLHAIQSAPLD